MNDTCFEYFQVNDIIYDKYSFVKYYRTCNFNILYDFVNS